MAKRMVEGKFFLGSQQVGCAKVEFDDGRPVDTTCADDEYEGDPIETPGRRGSAKLTMLEGDIPSGHAQGGAATCQWKEKTYNAGVESSATKTRAFTKVHITGGGSIGGEGRGEKRYAMTYGTSTET